jgi:hypothetical protein
MSTFNEGKITVTEKSITIKKFLGSTTIMKDDIRSIDHATGFMNSVAGVLNVILIANMGLGIRQLKGNPTVTIKIKNGKQERFNVHKADYQNFLEAL